VFTKSVHYALEDLAVSGYDVISLDWTMDPKQSRLDKHGINYLSLDVEGEEDKLGYLQSASIPSIRHLPNIQIN
jgi:hypothetical protein